MSITIRKMIPEDLPEVVGILSKWNMAPIEPTPGHTDPERSSINVGNSFVAVDGVRIVGVSSYIRMSEEVAETASLAVDPTYKGLGIGYALQVARLKEMKREGIRTVRTETDRHQTVVWYIKHFGYRITGEKKKKHQFSVRDVHYWTMLELDLGSYEI